MTTLQEIDQQIAAKEAEMQPFQAALHKLEEERAALRVERNKLTAQYRLVWIEPNGERFEDYSLSADYATACWTLKHQVDNRRTFGLMYRETQKNHFEADNEQGHWQMWLEENPLREVPAFTDCIGEHQQARRPNIPIYFGFGKRHQLPFVAWDMNNKVEPKVGDYYLQSAEGGNYLRIQVMEVNEAEKTFVLEAVGWGELD